MTPRLRERDLARLKKPHKCRPRDAEQVRSPLGSQDRLVRCDRNRLPIGHCRNHLAQRLVDFKRKSNLVTVRTNKGDVVSVLEHSDEPEQRRSIVCRR